MMTDCFRFEDFVLDPQNRQLKQAGRPVEISGRYLDALTLLVRESGRLVSKDRFLDEVWKGVPVTDEALTQCIRSLRRELGDNAASPRFIETVPKHGYRFIGAAQLAGHQTGASVAPALFTSSPYSVSDFLLLGGAATAGGGLAGLVGGLIYGMAGASLPLMPGVAAVSVFLVLVSLCLIIALVGAAGVGFGIAAAQFSQTHRLQWTILGGTLGGLIVGAVVKLLGLDAISLLFGQSPGDITGGGEGALLGAAIGLAAGLASRWRPGSFRRGAGIAALAGGLAGILIVILGGELMAGSLDLVARQFPGSRLRLDQIGILVGETGFGPMSRLITGALEGALFGGCLVGAMVLAGKRLGLELRS